jgi:hypothetical protein
LDGRDPILEDIADVAALLLSSEFVSVMNRVMVLVSGIISLPSLKWISRVLVFLVTVDIIAVCYADEELGSFYYYLNSGL